MKEIAVLGLGNLMRTDDAVGMLTLEVLRHRANLSPGVRLIEGGTLGLDLLGCLKGVTHLVAVDAVDAGEVPGTLLRYSGEQLSALPTSKSVHLLGFADLLGVMTLMEAAPLEVVLLGIQPEMIGWGTELTPCLQAKQEDLIQAVIGQVREWSSQRLPAESSSTSAIPALAS